MKKLKLDIWKTATIILAILLIISISTNFLMNKGMGKEKAGKIAIDYVNVLLQGQATAALQSVEEKNNLYDLKFSINNRPYEAYVTKDGKLLFPSVFNLEETPQLTPVTETP